MCAMHATGPDSDQEELLLLPRQLPAGHAGDMRLDIRAASDRPDRARAGTRRLGMGSLHQDCSHRHWGETAQRQGDADWHVGHLLHHHLLPDQVRGRMWAGSPPSPSYSYNMVSC